MKLIDALESGACGLRYSPKEGVLVRASERDGFAYTDEDRELHWLLHFGDVALDLAPEHDEVLTRDVERAARAILEGTTRQLEARAAQGKGPRLGAEARVTPPGWSPVVELKPVSVGTTLGLRVVHRTAYLHGMEMVMGHLLVPVAHGVVELRVTATDRVTGGRDRALEAAGEGDADDPRHDEKFPQHCLSRVRAALDELTAPEGIEVLRPAIALRTGTVQLPAFGGSLTLPPRFALVGPDDRDTLLFTRMSLANTDGLWRLAFAREDVDAITRQRTLRARVEALLAARFGLADLHHAKVELTHADDGSARLHVRIDAGHGMTPLASVWWLHPDNGLRGLQLSAPEGATLPDALAILGPAAASWRVESEA